VPLIAQGETIGAVYVDHRMTKGAFDEEDLRLAEAFAGQAAVAVHRGAPRHATWSTPTSSSRRARSASAS
jgi:GAF domain-containing protein